MRQPRIQDLTNHTETDTGLPKSNVLFFEMEDKSNIVVRPSGTEPIIKLYFGIPAKDEKEADTKIDCYKECLLKML